TPEFYSMMRLRKIWAEGSFSVLKREHCISKIRKRGISAAAEECLLAVMALNLKRMVKAIFNKLKIRFMWAEEVFPQPSFSFCQQVQILTLPFVNRSRVMRKLVCRLRLNEVSGRWRDAFQSRLQMLRVHVFLVAPLGTGHMAQPCACRHEGRTAVREGAHHTSPAADFPVEPLNDAVPPPPLGRAGHRTGRAGG
ncbi:Transposase DDE domain-containing protein, partial [Ruminococcaceae bacterium D5]